MKEAAAAQRTGLIDRRAGAAEKADLRREILAGPITHLAEVGRRASRDVHELAQDFQRKPSKGTYVGFLTAARTMQAKAEEHKAVLLKYGGFGAGAGAVRRAAGPVRGGGAARQQWANRAQGRHATAGGAGGRAGVGGADDGCAEPAAVRGECAAAGVVG